MPADAAGVKDGDRVVGLDGQRLTSFEQISAHVTAHPERAIGVEVEREGKVLRLSVEPRNGRIGVKVRLERMSTGEAIRQGVWMPLQTWATLLETSLARKEPRVPTFKGPVGITQREDGAAQALTAIAVHLSQDLPTLVMASLLLFLAAPAPRPQEVPAELQLQPGRAWTRWLARLLDSFLILFTAVVAEELADRPIALLVTLLSLPVEALLLATWGYTPGKWLLGVAVRRGGGGKLAFGEALHRAGAAMIYGLGAGLEFGIVTGLVAKRRLQRTGSTYWDDLGGFRVEHDGVSTGRAVLLMLVLAAAAWAMFFREFWRLI
jgi:uncharacterized RDD family membrane protein YckC